MKRKSSENSDSNKKKKPSDEVKLSDAVKPENYDIVVVPNFSDFTFRGQVNISVIVKSEVTRISLHAADLTILPEHVHIRSSEGATQTASQVNLDRKTETASFDFESPVRPGNYTLEIAFQGVLNDKLCGFYRSKYVNRNGEEKYMACTQFEATDARRALPCWDEPAVKATFDVTLIVPSHFTAVSNMPIILKSTPKERSYRGLTFPEGSVLYRYERTPVMSTYLLAFVVGEFDYLSTYTKDRVEVRIYTPVGKSHLGKFALDVATRALEFYNEWFDIPYPLPKVDLLGIPDFAAGAMENWGCITYREIRLLIDPENSSASVKQATAKTIAHELAHMWFGNLVTMDWWTNLWLNEGFARFMEHLAVDHIFPEWDIWTQFSVEVLNRALSLDSLLSSHPIEVPVKHPSEINEIFDTISYAKGASVIRMLQATIGEKAFQTGLRAYLKKHAYKNAATEDLWDALSDASKKDISALMSGWVQRTGYPVLSFQHKGTVEKDGSTELLLSVSQQRFLSSKTEAEPTSEHWVVPIQIAVYEETGKCATHAFELKGEKADLHVPLGKSAGSTFIKINPKHSSFFRTRYDEKFIASLAKAIASQTLPATDRLGLLTDSFALAQAGALPLTQALTLVQAYADEKDFSVVSTLATSLGSLARIHSEQPYYPLFQKFVNKLFEPSYLRLGFKPSKSEDSLTTMLRPIVINMMALSNDKRVIEEGLQLLAGFVKDEKKNPIAADMRYPVYNLAVRHGGREGWEKVMSIYRKSDSSEEKRRVLQAIGHSKDVEILKETLKWAMSEEVRSQDCMFAVASIASGNTGRVLAWEYLKEHWTAIYDKFGKGQNFLIAGLIDGVCNGFMKESDADEFERFFREQPCPSADRTIRQCSEVVRANAARLKRESKQLGDWLKQYQ